MNYGKTAYLKVLDLEKRIKQTNNSINNYNSCLELNKPNVDESFSPTNTLNIPFSEFQVYEGRNICFEIKVSIFASNEGAVTSKLNIDGLTIHQESKNLSKGDNEIIILKSFDPLTDVLITPSLTFTTENVQIATISSITMIILGVQDKNHSSNDIEIRALLINDNEALLSYIDSDKLYYLIASLESRQLDTNNFTFVKDAISHCYCKSSNLKDAKINLYRVDRNKNLYLSTPFDSLTETLVATNVVKVFASPCPSSLDDTNLVVYIKDDGECYYKTIREGTLTSEYKFNIFKGKYVDIKIASMPDSDIVYIILSHENGSSYILKSLVEVSTGKMVEMLSASAVMAASRYIDLGFAKDSLTEKLSLDIKTIMQSELKYNETIESLSQEKINLSTTFEAEDYKVTPTIIYGINIDTPNYRKPDEWISYSDDCVGFTPAELDVSSSTFIDNGWLDRWPFNEIRPCKIKDGKVVGYLNPNNYNFFEDGTPADIENYETGDVMIEFPLIYYKISKEGTTLRFQISNKKLSGFSEEGYVYKGIKCNKVYISAYLCGDRDFTKKGFHSYSNSRLLRNDITHVQVYSLLKKYCPENYEFMSFHHINMIAIMYLILFRTVKAYNYCVIPVRPQSEDIRTGRSNDKGLFYVNKYYENFNKLFGLEEVLGYKQQFCVGMSISPEGKISVVDVYDPNMTYDPNKIDTFKPIEEDYVPVRSSYAMSDIDYNGSNYTSFFGTKENYFDNYGFLTRGYFEKNNDPTSCLLYGYSTSDYTKTSPLALLAVQKSKLRMNSAVRLVYYPINQGE